MTGDSGQSMDSISEGNFGDIRGHTLYESRNNDTRFRHPHFWQRKLWNLRKNAHSKKNIEKATTGAQHLHALGGQRKCRAENAPLT